MILEPQSAIDADIYCRKNGKPYTGQTWPTEDGVAIILCPSCGKLDENNRPFSLPGEPSDGVNGCVECKSLGYLFVGC